MNFLILILIGLFAGVFSGLFGIGGGIIIVPLLIFFFKLSAKVAFGTSLVCFVLPVSLLGVIQYYKNQTINKENILYGLVIAVGLMLGSYIGAKISGHFDTAILQKSFAVLLVIAAIKLWYST